MTLARQLLFVFMLALILALWLRVDAQKRSLRFWLANSASCWVAVSHPVPRESD